ncbi:alpha/beta hydrolase [Streptomyces sp. NPDC056149]|uniref:alpha/beta hydrolase n=1 Tax=unclassified Streptomyces TaxID=2593676 RepID=UPI002380CCC0|nr:alpha/beta hydrolase-fold protein [Streptomyces sp. WZ-12]
MPTSAWHSGTSLLDGWLPLTLQIVAGVLLVLVIGWRTRRWRLVWLPVAGAVGLLAALLAMWYVNANALATDPAPTSLWVWIGITAAALAVAVLGWRSARWWRRLLSVPVIPMGLLCTGLVLNQWVGYFPTVQEAWSQISAGPLPDQVDAAQLSSLQNKGGTMTTGRVVGVNVPDTASHFTHREEYVYLPPAWFEGAHHPRLPVLMMVGGEFNTPADWIRTGGAISTIDAYAKAHHGQAPILVFADSGGSFNNDTECVNGPRGNAADHLTKDVRPYVVSHFGASPAAADWGVVGFSMGGTCAVDLAVMHPELFGSFEDIAGDEGPIVGTKQLTIKELYGGSTAAWARFDPLTVLAHHPRYADTAGWFDNSSSGGPGGRGGWGGNGPGGHGGNGGRQGGHPGHPHGHGGSMTRPGPVGFGGRDIPGDGMGNQTADAQKLCAAAAKKGIACTLHAQPGGHTWQLASAAFSDALPWLAERVHTPTASART